MASSVDRQARTHRSWIAVGARDFAARISNTMKHARSDGGPAATALETCILQMCEQALQDDAGHVHVPEDVSDLTSLPSAG